MESLPKQPFLKQPRSIQQPVIFFDGVCGLCNKFVDRLLKIDSKRIYLFAPLQGETAQNTLGGQPANPNEWSIVFADREGVHIKSTAVLRILSGFGGVRSVFKIFFIVPLPIRDWVYEFVASNRYKWFGKLSTCRIPTKEEKSRFLP